jgi:hypothetical protein
MMTNERASGPQRQSLAREFVAACLALLASTTNKWFWGLVFADVTAYYLFWVGPNVVWYAFEYGVPTDKVNIAPQPTDCDFWHAPVGFKDCHYERWVKAVCDPICPAVESNPNVKYSSVFVSWIKKPD